MAIYWSSTRNIYCDSIWFSFIGLASFLFVIISHSLTFMSFVSFISHVFGDKPLQLSVRLFRLMMNGWYLNSTGFILIRVGLTRHDSSFKNKHFVAKDLLKLNNTINACIIYMGNILYCPFSLNTCEFLIRQIYQWNCNVLRIITFLFKDTSRLCITKFIRYTSKTKLSWKVNIFIATFKLKYFFSIDKKITIISIIM